MSLTSFLRNNQDVRERFRQEFPKPKFSSKKELLAPPRSRRYSLVGTAFDYLLRFYLQYLNRNVLDKGYWIAELALEPLADYPGLHKKGVKIITQAKRNLAKFLKTGEINDALIASALSLGQLDPIYRAGVGYESIGVIHKNEISDLRKLISIVEPNLFTAQKLCVTNPIFGSASRIVGGADADLIIDDTIIDIKTTKELKLKGRDFHQIMGYYVLHQIGGVLGIKPKLKIKKVAIYFSRFAYMHVYEIKDIITPSTFPGFIKWFKKRAKKDMMH